MFVVEGIYDGETVTLARPVPVKGKTAVSVQFPIDIDNQDITGFEMPAGDEISIEKKHALLKELIGIASAFPMSLDEIKNARLARQ